MNDEDSMITMRPGVESALGRIDQYDLVRKLGGGGFGVVYLARDTTSDMDVALKTLHPLLKNSSEEMETLRETFKLAARLSHPNIASALVLHPVREVSIPDETARRELKLSPGDSVMVMRYAPGVTLSKWRRQFPDAVVPPDRAVEIGRQIAAALDYAHSEKVVHRDVKPGNVMVETLDDGKLRVRLLDFGLAAEIRSSMSRISNEAGDVSGTRPYMAPEQWLGETQDGRTDQYALACVLYELVSGAPPFAGVFETGDPVIMLSVVEKRAPKPVAGLPEAANAALLRALAKDPKDRFPSCAAFVEALAREAGGEKDHAEFAESGETRLSTPAICFNQTQERLGRYRAEWDAHRGAGQEAVMEATEQAHRENANASACEEVIRKKVAHATEDWRRAWIMFGVFGILGAVVVIFLAASEMSNGRSMVRTTHVTSETTTTRFVALPSQLTTTTTRRYVAQPPQPMTTTTRRYVAQPPQPMTTTTRRYVAPSRPKTTTTTRYVASTPQPTTHPTIRHVAPTKLEEHRVGERRIIHVGSAAIALHWCPPGSFMMGSPMSEDGRDADETQHLVTLTTGFWMGETEVTQGLWKEVMGSIPSENVGEDFPVENISWDDCQEFLRRLNGRAPAGWRFALPTEAQWEYACRAGSTGAYGGTGDLDRMGWYSANSGAETHPVGLKEANAWGLQDMHGNVWEWCADWYGTHSARPVSDPLGPASGVYRVYRGGCWSNIARHCRSANRDRYEPGYRYGYLGFRVALVPVLEQ